MRKNKGIIPKNFEEFRKKGTLACIGRKPWNKGKLHTKETKEKISEALKGRSAWNKGKSWSLEHKQILSKAHIGKRAWNKGKSNYWFIGQNNPNWKGGITELNHQIRDSIEYKLWREAVFKRDDYTCQICFSRGGVLNADHIKPFALYPELRFAIDNGQTLCENCHNQKTQEDMILIRKEVKPWTKNKSNE